MLGKAQLRGIGSQEVTRRERIAFLLEHYADVLAGLYDDRSDGQSVRLMCSSWNHPSYQELERLLPLLAARSTAAYHAVVATYKYPSFRRKAWCPRCQQAAPAERIGSLHSHGSRTVALVPRMVREPLYPVDERLLPLVLAWLDREWQGNPFVPNELLPVGAVA